MSYISQTRSNCGRTSQVASDIASPIILRNGFIIGGAIVGIGYMAINVAVVSLILLQMVNL